MLPRTRFRTLALLAAAASLGCGEPTSPDDDTDAYALLFERPAADAPNEPTLYVVIDSWSAPVAFLPATVTRAEQPRASANGRWVAYMSQATGGANDAVWIARSDGSSRRQVYTSANTILRPAPSPDGTRIAFVQYDAALTSSRIWVVNADGTDARIVTSAAHEDAFVYTAPAWSPDGTRLAFAMGTPGSLRIATMPSAGGEIALVTQPASGSDTEPAYSPTGDRIVFVHTTSTTVSNLAIADLAAGTQRTILSANGRQPAWSPDGNSVVVSARLDDGTYDIYLVPIAGGAAFRLATTTAGGRHPNWIRVDPFAD